MECRDNCGACCIVPSISSALPKLPEGKAGGVHCPHLDENYRCDIFESPKRPKVCGGFTPEPEFCGTCRNEAIEILAKLQGLTKWDHL
ncbi:YkgJ family cysteine cluster protein [Carboxylicivirga sp. M1479]|uniref:YkgJ family cysteine cluster protein n=1 Tax=Carboxylicivirga sp. M1479 TaxID=2594476 RepID=UPI00117855F8|nr:YkgJ family cysteine cluster protein [Carboxylicivirga sp. M1479]TRX63266.1 YkgJ family cysteine cluster protein [Carboxylicivirga sp. M1479]